MYVVDTAYNIEVKYQRDEHRVHLIVYHLVWCPKRRNSVLMGKIAEDCKVLIEAKCHGKGWQILELAIQTDHIHLFVRVWPTVSAAEVIKQCKGITSHELRRRYSQAAFALDAELFRFYSRECQQRHDPAIYRRTEGTLNGRIS